MTFERVGADVSRLGNTVVPERAVYAVQGDSGSPSLRVEFEIRGGTPVCVGVHVEADQVGRGVLSGDLTTLPSLSRLAVEVFVELSSVAWSDADEAAIDGLSVADQIRAKVATQFAAKTNRAARKAVAADVRTGGDAELQEVARVYAENVHEKPLQAVQTMLDLSPNQASRRIAKARDKGYLPRTTPGKRNA
ncbi:hypothetical protein [Humibacter sp.]|uniref:hypothetical protein n=1 Tax=Humibacter sp. TaxID=1940291 RepID=UPI003F7E1F24